MKGMMVTLLVLVMLGAPLAVAGVASAAGTRDLTPVVDQGVTDRLGGGDWISVVAGDARVGVVYGTVANPNKVYVFAEYKRFLGGADVYDSQGNLLRSTGIPVYTLFGQSFDSLIEFRDQDGNGLINLHRYYQNDTTRDVPAKATGLVRAWTATTPTTEVSGNTTWVNFTVSAQDVPYDWVWIGRLPRRGTAADGALDELAFTFHLKVDVSDVEGQVPWWKVTVSDANPRRVVGVESLGNRTYAGQAVAMGAKYDHLISGWDFASASDNLTLETRAFIAYYVPEPVGQFIHAAYRTEAGDDNGYRQHENDTEAPEPRLLTRDHVYVNDDWERVGRLVWTNDVTVDGQPEMMRFQVQGGEVFRVVRGAAVFEGFAIRGAYIYPAGAAIQHDPGLEAATILLNITENFSEPLNLVPITVLILQVAIAGIAVVSAVLLRVRGRRAK